MIPAAAQKLSPALQAVVDAERAFARASVEHGQREAFLTYLADDGITFSPHPGPGKDAIRQRPPPASPREIVLNWAPMTGGASRSADMGFTTGPYILEDRSPEKRPARHGMYFTVWKNVPDGVWRAAIDAGILLDAPMAPVARLTFTPLPHVGTGTGRATKDPATEQKGLRAADEAFSEAAKTQGLREAARRFIRDDGRLHRNGHTPVIGHEAIDFYYSDQPQFAGEIMFASVSKAADLGYTYGRYELTSTKSGEKGYYVRLWTRDPGKDWKVLLETYSPLPE